MNIGDAIGATLKGAGVGLALGPVGAAAGGIGGLVLDLAPELGNWLFGDNAGKTVTEVAQAVETVAGTTDAAAAAQAIHDDPAARVQLRVQLAKIAADRQAEKDAARSAELALRLADVANARSTYSVTRDGTVPRLAYITLGATYVCTATLFGIMLVQPIVDANIIGLIGVVLGYFWQDAKTIINFYFGSSVSSERKTEIISSQLRRPQERTTVATTTRAPAQPTTVTETTGPTLAMGGIAPTAIVPFSESPLISSKPSPE